MAGIGFELKKIYRKDGISRSLVGATYSSVITIGPTILVIVAIILLYLFLGMSNVGMYKREVLSCTILYIFIFSVILTSPFNSVFSRYLADKFYTKQTDDILCSYYTGILLVSAISMVMALPVLFSMYFKGGLDLPYVLAAYAMWASAVIIFFSITYLHATKDYKVIALFFLIAMVVGSLTAWLIYRFTWWDQIHSIIYGLAVGFFIIAFCEFSYIRFYFKGSGQNYTECLAYLWRFRRIFFTNLFYILGLYVHNFVFWTIPSRLSIANTFICHQGYDMATCLAMFTNISTTVIFTVLAETRFHETYQDYMEGVIGATYKVIQKNKKIMFRTLSQQFGQVFGLQIAITSVIFLFLEIFGIQIGFSSLTMKIYPVLAASYHGVFVMYCNIVYLYYFEDTFGSMMTGFIFCFVTFIGSLISKEFSSQFWGVGLFAGQFAAMIYGYIRLRHVERDFESHIFCRYRIIATMKSSEKGKVVYKKGV